MSLVSDALVISCLVEKSNIIPSCNESLKMISFDDMIDVANPDGVSGLSHKKHPCYHKFATDVGIAHSIPFASR